MCSRSASFLVPVVGCNAPSSCGSRGGRCSTSGYILSVHNLEEENREEIREKDKSLIRQVPYPHTYTSRTTHTHRHTHAHTHIPHRTKPHPHVMRTCSEFIWSFCFSLRSERETRHDPAVKTDPGAEIDGTLLRLHSLSDPLTESRKHSGGSRNHRPHNHWNLRAELQPNTFSSKLELGLFVPNICLNPGSSRRKQRVTLRSTAYQTQASDSLVQMKKSQCARAGHCHHGQNT